MKQTNEVVKLINYIINNVPEKDFSKIIQISKELKKEILKE